MNVTETILLQICGCGPKEMSKRYSPKFTPKEHMLLYGLRPLHTKVCIYAVFPYSYVLPTCLKLVYFSFAAPTISSSIAFTTESRHGLFMETNKKNGEMMKS